MSDRKPSVPDAFPFPWRVAVNPSGATPGETENIFILDADGGAVAIVGKHPVWRHKELARPDVARMIVEAMNRAHAAGETSC